jgi:AraC-like DNA-binding protein
MDVLSDTLQVVRLTGAVFLDASLAAPWAFESSPPSELAQYLRLPTDCIALFHILVRGQGWFSVPGYAPVLLRSGDAILLPHSTPHLISSGHRTTPVPIAAVLPPYPAGRIVAVGTRGQGEVSQLICGFLHCDQRFNPLLGALPTLIVVRPCQNEDENGTFTTETGKNRKASGAPAAMLPVAAGEWLETTLRHTVEEALSGRPGNAEMLARLSEILFVEVVRRYMQQLPSANHGWLAGVRDPIVGQALRLLHAQPERAWTVEELAQEVAVARSTLAQRFTALIGESPMHYLAGWRIQLAKYHLKQSNVRLADIATRVGYDSEAAFSRAFRRHVGHPPAAWREAGENR